MISEHTIRIPSYDHYSEIQDWCNTNNVDAIYLGCYRDNDLWFIKSLSDRMLFVLRWK